jgi:hypothetical protein
MKKLNLILQSKGGAGKSFFLWFVAQAEKEKSTAFIDLDESTKTSSSRLASIVGEQRIKHFKILNENKKLDREKILNLFEKLAQSNTDSWYIDFGAPESEEFKKLLEHDLSAQIMIDELKILGAELNIYILIAGKDALVTCLQYYSSMLQIMAGSIPVLAIVNEGTFGSRDSVDKGKEQLEATKIPFKSFGYLGDDDSGRDVIRLITEQKDPSTLNFAGRLAYRRVLESVQKIID